MKVSASPPDDESPREEVILRARAMVDQYPADLAYRGLLGAALCQAGRYSEAVPELQEALGLAALRPLMLLCLHECYGRIQMNDLSVLQLRILLSELPAGLKD
jgi:predicted Zn-dependent protease